MLPWAADELRQEAALHAYGLSKAAVMTAMTAPELCNDAALAAGEQARLRTKQALLSTLLERLRDQSHFTRARCLHAWALLAKSRAIPLGHWRSLAELTVGMALFVCVCLCTF